MTSRTHQKPSQLRITCVTVVPKLGEVQCNWKLQWSLAQRHAHNATAMLHPPYPDQCSSSYYAESIKWGDKRTAKEHTSAKVDEGFDGVFEVAAEFAHALANKLETDAMLLQWSAAFECTGGVATLRPSVGKAIKIWTKHRPLGRVIVILSSNAIAFAASEMYGCSIIYIYIYIYSTIAVIPAMPSLWLHSNF